MPPVFITKDEVISQGMTYGQAYSFGRFYRLSIDKRRKKSFIDLVLIDHYKQYLEAWKVWMQECFPEQYKG